MLPHRLCDGYHSFLGNHFARERARYQRLSEQGQKPEIMVIGCCDSRVAPEIIFNAAPGELFVVRNIANLVPPYLPDDEYHGTSAALEFAVECLMVKHIVVLGHAHCGGINAYVRHKSTLHSSGQFIDKWMNLVEPAAKKIGHLSQDENYLHQLELEAINNSLKNLTSFPSIRRRVNEGSLKLHGAYFGIALGQLLVRDPQSGLFNLLDASKLATDEMPPL